MQKTSTIDMAASFYIAIFLALLVNAAECDKRDHIRNAPIKLHPLKNEDEAHSEYWNSKAQALLAGKLTAIDADKEQKAKNVILFVGDGMSIHTITASRNLMGDSAEQFFFEKFLNTGLSRTYCVNRQVADSACTATAYLGGVKGNYGTIGVNAKVSRYHCVDATKDENQVKSIAKWAQDAGKNAGLVTTARVTHASPAGVYAHTADRNWENDAEIILRGCNATKNLDIARQLVEWPVGKRLKVILGGGRQNFLNITENDEEGLPGLRTDGRNLINDWLADKHVQNAEAHYVWSKKGLNMLNLNETDYLLGLFSSSHCPYHGDLKRQGREQADPSLSEMTASAIKVLQRNENGFFLFVEGARIDMAHHDTFARRALEDTVEFDNAVRVAREMTSMEDTLIVVTSDHSHTMTINGYPYRDQDITGLAGIIADDGKPYTTLSYANGPGYYNTYSQTDGRKLITEKSTHDAEFKYMTLVPLDAETHGGDDVGVFASGPFSQYFSGSYEQTNIPAMMARAANFGPFANI